jgi:hypothetical protein
MTRTPQSVVSGVPYPVTAVDGSESPSLEALVGETEFTVDVRGTAYVVQGAGNWVDERIRFHEKNGLGRDVRVWHVSAVDGGLTAEHVAAF